MTSTIRDQREMIGYARHQTVEDVEAAWEAWAAEHGFGVRRRRGDYSTEFRTSRKVVKAYVSGGKWVADCPGCNGGIAVWPDNPRGACLDCGTIYRVDHPSAADAERAIELLSVRPDPVTRSWHRHQGETADDLARENDVYLAERQTETGAVAVDDVARVLGDRAVAKLRSEGVL